MMKPKVYFTREITPESVVAIYHKLGIELPGKVAVKGAHRRTGQPELPASGILGPMVEVKGMVVGLLYGDASGGVRDHRHPSQAPRGARLIRRFDVDIMDAEGPDVIWPIPNGKVLKENRVGKHILRYDSMLVLAHFKGHPRGRLRRGAQAAASVAPPAPARR